MQILSTGFSQTTLPPAPVIHSSSIASGTGSSVQNVLSNLPAGTLLVLTIAQKDDASRPNASVASSPALTWTKRADAQATASGNAEIYTAVFSAGGAVTVTSKWSSGGLSSVLYAITNFDNTAFIGEAGTGNNQLAPQVNISSTRDASLLFAVSSDKNRVSGASRTYRSGAVESFYHFLSKAYTAYHYYLNSGWAGSYSMGLTAPSTMNAGTAVLEIKPPVFISPVANAGSNQTITLPISSLTLNGSASTGSITSYAWKQVSGPNTSVIGTPSAASTLVSGLIAGTYVFELSLNNSYSTSQVTVTVNPEPIISKAGNDQTVTLPTSSVTLSNSGSTGMITSYLWSQVSGPNTAIINSPTSATTLVSGLIQGIYIFRLTLNGGVSSDDMTVTVLPEPVIANAGPNQTILLPTSSVVVNGSASTGLVTSYLWSQVSGPNSAILSTPLAVSTTVSGLIQGTYLLRLSVNGGISADTVQIIVQPAPVANAGIDQSIILPTNSVTLSGTGSSGTILSYLWSQLTGPNTANLATPTAVSTTASGLVQGTYSFRFSLNGGTSIDTVQIIVQPAPLANAGIDQTITLPVNSVSLNGSASSGTITSYAWDQISGPNTAVLAMPGSVSTTASGLIQGVYLFRLTLNGGTSRDTILVTVNPEPNANAGIDQSIILPTNSVLLNGNGSVGAITSYAWSQVSGPNTALLATPASVSTTASGLIQGIYLFRLAINGASSADTVKVTVNPPPVANAGPDTAIILPVNTVTLRGTSSSGTITSYAWSQLSGPNTAVLATPTTVTTTASGMVQGVYFFRLSLNGGTSLDTLKVTVNPAPVSNAGADTTITLPTSSVTLRGNLSTGTITSYLWSQVSGPSASTLSSPASASTTASGLVQGQYVFRLSLNGGTSTDDVVITVQSSVTGTTTVSIFTSQTPSDILVNDGTGGIQLGVKFRTSVSGNVTGIRFYKAAGNTGTHTGELYTTSGQRLASAIFTGETASGWQQVLFSTPVAINANTTYIVSYYSASGYYSHTDGYFSSAVTNNPLTALADGTDGSNGLYAYTNTATFPTSSYAKTNYWVDVVFSYTGSSSGGGGGSSLAVSSVNPTADYSSISVSTGISAVFNKSLNTSTVNTQTVNLSSPNGTVSASVTYNSTNRSIIITPSAPLENYTLYKVTLKGGASSPKILDIDGLSLAADYSWSFITEPNTNPGTDPAVGPGGPILVITSGSNPFTKYTAEILRAEGFNLFTVTDISNVTATLLSSYDVAILGEMTLTATQVSTLSTWATNGGNLICFRPDNQLMSLLGISGGTNTLSDRYLLVNTQTGPGIGIVNSTIQYHGSAKLYSLNGATSLATLYSGSSSATSNPAVTERSVGTNGGKAYAFAFDLPKSVIYTRQGNPAWAGQERDGQTNIRASDMFYPDWIDLNKVHIPQADEQQHLLANIIIKANLAKKPLPRFWILPRKLKAAVVMTGDDHASGGTTGRFNQYLGFGNNTAADIMDWKAVRGSSYLFSSMSTSTISNSQVVQFNSQGFDIGLHLNTGCSSYTYSSLQSYFNGQLSEFKTKYPGLPNVSTHRTHCISWSDWSSKPIVERSLGIRLNTDYYYWPGSWILDRPGMFTGSGMPMRYADIDGTILDNYQVTTQLTDESNITYSTHINSLLDKAIGVEGYYGVFCANMHTDVNGGNSSNGSDIIISSARSRNIPVITAKQMLVWLDGRNNSAFTNLLWNGSVLAFNVTAASGAYKLQGMLPFYSSSGQLTGLALNGVPISYTTETIKGISYAFFDAVSGAYSATYSAPLLKTGGTLPSIEDKEKNNLYALGQNFPNPISSQSRISYRVPTGEHADIILYDVLGRPVQVLVDKFHEAGVHEVYVDASRLRSGTYYYKMRSGNYQSSRRLIVK